MTDRYTTSHLTEDQYEPGSNGTVLRNLLGITSKEEMEHVEEERFERLMEEAANRFDSDHRFTALDILWLHKFWLDGVFPWAGAYRSVNIGKGGFMFAAAAHLPELMRQFENDQLARLTPCRFESDADVVTAMAEVHVELVLIHPFREGNGRIARLLSVLMALQAGLPPLDFSELWGAKREEYFAAVRAGIDRDYRPMERVFSGIVERTLTLCGR
ncbi:MAG: cell filamentation protein Fic [Geobacter sp.]|nr:MAG: cell filamentation protein Fic [Geobacter sp.]